MAKAKAFIIKESGNQAKLFGKISQKYRIKPELPCNAAGFSNMAEDTYSAEYYYGTKDPGSKWEVPGVAYPLYYRAFVAAGDVDEAALRAKYKRSK